MSDEGREKFDQDLVADPAVQRPFGSIDPNVMKVLAAAKMPQQVGASQHPQDLWRPGMRR